MTEEKKWKVEELLDTIIEGDCLKVMDYIPSESVDMVFFDPPYFLQLPPKRLLRWEVKTEAKGVSEEWDKFASFEEYDNFIRNALEKVREKMAFNATIWAIGTYHNIHRVGKIMQDLGFWILNDVIWYKTNPMPNWLSVRFTNATETIIWATRDKKSKKYVFNKEEARKFAEEDSIKFIHNKEKLSENALKELKEKSRSRLSVSVWRLPLCSGKERLREGKKAVHPTQKPEALMERIISVSTKPNAIVFDPMAGTGTTGFVAKKLGRRFIMIENKKKYIEAMQKRFATAGFEVKIKRFTEK